MEFAVKNNMWMKEKWSNLKVSAIQVFNDPKDDFHMTLKPCQWMKISFSALLSLIAINQPDWS